MEPSRQSLLHEQSGKKGTADSVMTHEPIVKPLVFCAPSLFFLHPESFHLPVLNTLL